MTVEWETTYQYTQPVSSGTARTISVRIEATWPSSASLSSYLHRHLQKPGAKP